MNGRKFSDCTYCDFYCKKDSDEPCKSCVHELSDMPSNYHKGFVANPYDEKTRTAFMEYVMGSHFDLIHAICRGEHISGKENE